VVMLVLTLAPAPLTHSSLKEVAAPLVHPLKDHIRGFVTHSRGH